MKKNRVWLVVGIVILVVVLISLWPHKFAATQSQEKNYIVCKYQKVTDSNFCVVDEKSGEWVEEIWVENVSEFYNRSNRYDLDFMCADNTFYFYGEFDGITEGGVRIFKLESWDIKYPVKRDVLNFFPFNWFLSNINMFW